MLVWVFGVSIRPGPALTLVFDSLWQALHGFSMDASILCGEARHAGTKEFLRASFFALVLGNVHKPQDSLHTCCSGGLGQVSLHWFRGSCVQPCQESCALVVQIRSIVL